MRGGSQAVMLRCSDGNYYIVKMMGNPQGTTVLGNDFLGTTLLAALGLPVPSVTGVHLTKAFIAETPALWFETKGRTPPVPGMHFGSCLVGDIFGKEWPTEYLSPSQFPLISNRSDFLEMLVFDAWANNQDKRQAIYVEGESGPRYRSIKAVFIDNGYMFGGPDGLFRDQEKRCLYDNKSMYAGLGPTYPLEDVIAHFRTAIVHILPSCLRAIPNEWYSFEQSQMQETLMNRLAHLEILLEPYEEFLKG